MNVSLDFNTSRFFTFGSSHLVSDPLHLSRNPTVDHLDPISQLNLTIEQWLPNLTEVISVATSSSSSSSSSLSSASTDNSSTVGHLFGGQIDCRLLFVVTPFALVFFAAIFGNMFVIATLVIDRRMRTVTNAFLLNLAVADLLLGIFCMPFTLLGFIMRQFMFGAFMCKLVSYLQAVSVCVSSWTLVTMSVERYYAICQPFRSKSERQTWSHAYKMIGVLWAVSLIFMSPIAFLSELQPTRDPDKFKCRERWPSEHHLIVFTILLDVLLFLIPLIVMTGAYSRIILHLRGLVGLAHSHSLQHSVRRTNTGMAVSRESNGVQSARRESTHTMVSNAYNRTDTSLPPSCSSPPLPTSPSITTSHLQLASLSIDSEPNAKTVNNNHVNAIDLHKQNGDAGDSNSVEAGGAVRNHALLCERSSDESFGSMSLNQRSLHSILHHSNSPARTGPKKLHLVPPNESTALTGDAFSMPINENGSVYSDVSPNDGQHQRTQSKTSNHPLVHPNSHLTSSNQTRSVVQLRSSVDRHLAEKRQSHVLRMLVTVIVEFFVCWTPLHVINLLSLYYPQVVYQAIGYDGLSFLYWLAYLSTCTNPITYCFMNRRFRRSFRALFTCGRVRTDTSVSSRRSNHTAHASSSRL